MIAKGVRPREENTTETTKKGSFKANIWSLGGDDKEMRRGVPMEDKTIREIVQLLDRGSLNAASDGSNSLGQNTYAMCLGE